MNDKIWENIPPWHHLYGIVVIYAKYKTKQRCTYIKYKWSQITKHVWLEIPQEQKIHCLLN